MSKTYKGWELMKEITEGKIKKGTEFKCETGSVYRYVNQRGLCYVNNLGDIGQSIQSLYELERWLNFDFKPIEDEIDIQEIEEVTLTTFKEVDGKTDHIKLYHKFNEIIKGIKQLDRKIKEKE